MIVITNLPPQIMDENVVTIIDAWESLEALCNHLGTPHMLAYQERASDIVENVSLKVLQGSIVLLVVRRLLSGGLCQ